MIVNHPKKGGSHFNLQLTGVEPTQNDKEKGDDQR